MVIVCFPPLVLVSGTVFHLTSNLCSQLKFSTLVLKKFSSLAVFLILTNCKGHLTFRTQQSFVITIIIIV